MNGKRDQYDDAWLERLDAIVIEEEISSPATDDDELLQIAAQLFTDLAPLREMDSTAQAHLQRLETRLYAQKLPSFAFPKRWVFQPRVLIAIASLLLLLGLGVLSIASPQALAATWNSIVQVEQNLWYKPTDRMINVHSASTPFIPPPPVKMLSPTKVKLLLPVPPPPNTQLVRASLTISQLTPVRYTAHYRIAGQDVYLSEQLTSSSSSSISASMQTVQIGSIQGEFYDEGNGNTLLTWHEDGVFCQLTGKLPITQLVEFARQFRLTEQ
jgi:hypothetical protein